MFFNKKTSDFCDLSVVEGGGVPVTPNSNILDGGSHNFLENYDQCTVPPVPPPTQVEDSLKNDELQMHFICG